MLSDVTTNGIIEIGTRFEDATSDAPSGDDGEWTS